MFVLILIFLRISRSLKYPIGFTTIRYINPFSSTLLADLGLDSSLTSSSPYNIISLSGYSSSLPHSSPLQFWTNPQKYLPTLRYGSTTSQIQQNLKLQYSKKGIKLLVHISDGFLPLSQKLDSRDAAHGIAEFVVNNGFDGVCVEMWERSGFANLKNGDWILNFTRVLRAELKEKIIAYQQFPTDFVPGMAFNPIAPYFSPLIDFLIIKYYNFQLPDYSTYSSIFLQSSLYPGSTVKDLISLGLLPNQIVIGKPASEFNSYAENFYVKSEVLAAGFVQGFNELGWYAGYAGNQWYYDKNGTFAGRVMVGLKQLCEMSETCR